LRPLEQQDNNLICCIIRDIGLYTYSRIQSPYRPSVPVHFLPQHGRRQTFTCARCAFFEESSPTECPSCGLPNEMCGCAHAANSGSIVNRPAGVLRQAKIHKQITMLTAGARRLY
jgi:hypothetical protein